eukprot:968661-Amphidinium_carterae.1
MEADAQMGSRESIELSHSGCTASYIQTQRTWLGQGTITTSMSASGHPTGAGCNWSDPVCRTRHSHKQPVA